MKIVKKINIKSIASYFFLTIFSTYLLILYVFIYEICVCINYILILLKLFEKLNFNKNQLSEIEIETHRMIKSRKSNLKELV